MPRLPVLTQSGIVESLQRPQGKKTPLQTRQGARSGVLTLNDFPSIDYAHVLGRRSHGGYKRSHMLECLCTLAVSDARLMSCCPVSAWIVQPVHCADHLRLEVYAFIGFNPWIKPPYLINIGLMLLALCMNSHQNVPNIHQNLVNYILHKENTFCTKKLMCLWNYYI